MTFEIAKRRFEISLRSKHPVTFAKLLKRCESWHFVWWKLSVYSERPDDVTEQRCGHCSGPVRQVGDDGIDVCDGDGDCGIVEGSTVTMTARQIEALQ